MLSHPTPPGDRIEIPPPQVISTAQEAKCATRELTHRKQLANIIFFVQIVLLLKIHGQLCHFVKSDVLRESIFCFLWEVLLNVFIRCRGACFIEQNVLPLGVLMLTKQFILL